MKNVHTASAKTGIYTGRKSYLPNFISKIPGQIPLAAMVLTDEVLSKNPKAYIIVVTKNKSGEYFSYAISGRFKKLGKDSRKNHVMMHRKIRAALKQNILLYNRKKSKYTLRAGWFFDQEIHDYIQWVMSKDPSQVPDIPIY